MCVGGGGGGGGEERDIYTVNIKLLDSQNVFEYLWNPCIKLNTEPSGIYVFPSKALHKK